MRQSFGWPIEEQEAMYPFERDAYLMLLEEWAEKKAERAEKAKNA